MAKRMKDRVVLRAACLVDDATYEAILTGAAHDRPELPNLTSVLTYCLKLGIVQYLEGHAERAEMESTEPSNG